MARRSDIKAIMKSKSLTGKEAVTLIIRDLVETDHGRPAILTEAEIQRLRAGVSRLTAQNVEDFNSWMELYRIVGYTLKEAQVLHLEIRLHLSSMERMLLPFITQHWLNLVIQRVPYCVTEKQWQDIRERRLQQRHCLAEVVDARAGHLSDGRWWEEEETSEEAAAILEQATREIAELLASHNLEPVKLEGCADYLDLGEPEWLSLYLTEEQLVKAGLPEWTPDVYHIMEADSERTGWRAELAVVREPLKSSLDERGWYVETWMERLSIVPELDARDEEQAADMRQTLQRSHTALRKMLRVFLAHQPVLEALSELIGVKLHEDLETWLATIHEDVAGYREVLATPLLQPLPAAASERLKRVRPNLPTFTMEDLRPDPQQVQHLRERMALALTSEEQFETFSTWLGEQCEEIDELEDRLAEGVSGDEGAEA